MRPTFLLTLAALIAPYAYAQAISPATPLKTMTIKDRDLGIPACSLSIPESWQFDGTVFEGVATSPSLAFRAYSPDGLTEMQVEPMFHWTLISDKDSRENALIFPGHIYMKTKFTAAEFARTYATSVLDGRVGGPTTAGDTFVQKWEEQMRSESEQVSRLNTFGDITGDVAALRVAATNGSFAMEERVRARIMCTLWKKPLKGNLGSCSAQVDVLSAPKGQLDALVAYVDTHALPDAKFDDAWRQRVIATMNSGARVPFDPVVPHYDVVAWAVQRRQDADLFPRAFWAEQQIPERSSRPMALDYAVRSQASVYGWADYAIALDAVSPHDKPPLSKVVFEWSRKDGKSYLTPNPGANPHGTLTGTWTVKSRKFLPSEQPTDPK